MENIVKMLRAESTGAEPDQNGLDYVHEFSDIPGPGVAGQPIYELRRNIRSRSFQLFRESLDGSIYQETYIGNSL